MHHTDPQHAPPSPASPTPLRPPGRLEGHLLDHVRQAYRDAADAGEPRHAPFVVAVGALAVYARACRVPLDDLLHDLERALATEPLPQGRAARVRSRLWTQAEHAVTSNYYVAD